jgi:short-subunit dehydrogenase
MYYFLYGFLYTFSLLPWKILYLISDGTYVLVYHIIGYRRQVVMSNLLIAFPGKTQQERVKIAKEFYHNFLDTFIETLKFLSLSDKEFSKRLTGNFELLSELYEAGQNVQLLSGHFFNWEYMNWGISRNSPYPLIGVYAPVSAGYDLIVCARSGEDLDKLKEEFTDRFPAISIERMTADIGDIEQVKNFGKWILESGYAPEVLVNNAGYFIPGNIYNEEEGTLQRMMEVNLNSAYHLTRTLLPAMMERRKGHIFNICSIASFKPMADVGSYGISKFALYGFSKHLREELKPYGIKVTAVCPGATYTSSWEQSDVNPHRLLEADDIAEMVFACSQLSASAVVEDIIIRPQLGDL